MVLADQRFPDDLSPALKAVLSSLSVSLEDELNRYRRNRLNSGSSIDDVFAELDDSAFDDASFDRYTLDAGAVTPATTVSTIAVSAAMAALLSNSPPSLPLNKKLLAGGKTTANGPGSFEATANVNPSPMELLATLPFDDANVSSTSSNMSSNNYPANSANSMTNGYLASSEKLIESLAEVPSMPQANPIDTQLKPKRKTASLLAGATLGLLGLVAGLGASYLMSNPKVAQRLAAGFGDDRGAIATASKDTFHPPGPDLSAQEFVDIKIDNLSSLEMPQTAIDPLSAAAAPTSSTALPPIASQPGAQLPPPTGVQAGAQTEIQAAVIPAGTNYYVTVPFTTEQGLADVRQSVAEAFVRQFSDGNRVQLAAFNSPAAAQQFIEELKSKGVTAQVYGPTNE